MQINNKIYIIKNELVIVCFKCFYSIKTNQTINNFSVKFNFRSVGKNVSADCK